MDTIIIVGTYTKPLGHVNGKAKGVHVLRHKVSAGTLDVVALDVVGFGEGPSYLSTLRSERSDDGSTLRVALVACNEGDANLTPSTLSYAELSIPTSGGDLSAAVVASCGGVATIGFPSTPCHVAAHGHWVVAATYCGGSVSTHRVVGAEDRGTMSVSDAVCLVQHKLFSNVDQGRQEAAHAHQAVFLNDATVLVCDLGADSVTAYDFDAVDGHLALRDVLALPPGCGPRHLVAHPTKPFVFVLGELNNTIYCCTRAAAPVNSGATLTLVSSTPCDPVDGGGAAGIAISRDGTLVFASFRGACDRVEVLRFDDVHGRLIPAGRLLVDECPRDICLHPTAQFLYVASQNGDTVTVYPYMVEGNDVTFLDGVVACCPTPVCLIPIAV
jgi:6-phosphogluconolactonase